MHHFLLVIFLIVSSVIVTASNYTTPYFVPKKTVGKYYIKIAAPSFSQIDLIAKYGPIIDKRQGTHLLAYATDEDLKFLNKNHFDYTIVYNELNQKKWIGSDNNYLSYREVTEKLKDLADRYPKILQVSSIGKTVEGRDIWAVKISKDVKVHWPLPEVKLVSTMHGDEIVGQELLLKLIDLLTQKYNKEARITNLVDKTQIWIIPNLNYDGTARRTRYNANRIDLNRDFPDIRTGDYINTPENRAPETRHMMNFTAKRYFVLSANFHGGAVVVNYPWDSLPVFHPENEFILNLSKEYAHSNIPMYQSNYFPGGIVNGYDWYPVYGGMQDWNYFFHNCIDLTVELSNKKWPAYGQVNNYWEDNRESILKYIERSHKGVHGFIVDADTGIPLMTSYKIEGISKEFHTLFPHGDFHKPLLDGVYKVTFYKNGYKPQVIHVDTRERSIEHLLHIRLEKKNYK